MEHDDFADSSSGMGIWFYIILIALILFLIIIIPDDEGLNCEFKERNEFCKRMGYEKMSDYQVNYFKFDKIECSRNKSKEKEIFSIEMNGINCTKFDKWGDCIKECPIYRGINE